MQLVCYKCLYYLNDIKINPPMRLAIRVMKQYIYTHVSKLLYNGEIFHDDSLGYMTDNLSIYDLCVSVIHSTAPSL